MAKSKSLHGDDAGLELESGHHGEVINWRHAEPSQAASSPSPALRLRADLELAIEGSSSMAIPNDHYSPRLVTIGVISFCIACWGAIYLAISAF